MTRIVTIGVGQLGPISHDESRASVVERLILMLRQSAERSCDLIVFPELGLTTFFPYVSGIYDTSERERCGQTDLGRRSPPAD